MAMWYAPVPDPKAAGDSDEFVSDVMDVADRYHREEVYDALKRIIDDQMSLDINVLNSLRKEISPIRNNTKRMATRTTNAVSLVGTDGGNNKVKFDPFLVQIIRVVDSNSNEHCLEAVTATSDVTALSLKHIDATGPKTPMGRMMDFLSVRELPQLSPMIRRDASTGAPSSPHWVQVYRELTEWAVMFDILNYDRFPTDVVLVFDGLLRSKMFHRTLFADLMSGFAEQIRRHESMGRKVYLAGVAKHSKVLDRYRLAMRLEHIMRERYPCFAHVPRQIEEKAYTWAEYARGNDAVRAGGEANKFVGGQMFLAKFGPDPDDPIWPVDIFEPQADRAEEVFGALLNDAEEGFPVPYYPMCLQLAHDNAAMVGFDFAMVQDMVFDSIRSKLSHERHALDEFVLQTADASDKRYND